MSYLENVSLDLQIIFYCFFFFYSKLYLLFVDFGNQALVSYIICKYFLPIYIDCLFVLFMVSFFCANVQKLVSLIMFPSLFFELTSVQSLSRVQLCFFNHV